MSKLVELIQQWEVFASLEPKASVKDFIAWSFQKQHGLTDKKRVKVDSNATNKGFLRFEAKERSSIQATYLFVRLSQYIFHYSKPMMRKHGLNSIDDFGYLQNIKAQNGGITKSKLCSLMLHEITTGTDIIKRLLKIGFVKEKLSDEDRRAKLLTITKKGEEVISAISKEFSFMPDTLVDMPQKDRDILINWLIILDSQHNAKLKEQNKNK
jgi:DNA-binding MarR family transcriptional regulator